MFGIFLGRIFFDLFDPSFRFNITSWTYVILYKIFESLSWWLKLGILERIIFLERTILREILIMIRSWHRIFNLFESWFFGKLKDRIEILFYLIIARTDLIGIISSGHKVFLLQRVHSRLWKNKYKNYKFVNLNYITKITLTHPQFIAQNHKKLRLY